MKEAEFDEYAERYEALHAASIAITGEGPEYFAEYKIRDIARAVGTPQRPRGLGRRRSAGAPGLRFRRRWAGSGLFVHRHLPGAQLTCLDVSRRSLEVAEELYADGTLRPFRRPASAASDEQFDIAFAACVFHHIDHAEHPVLLRDCTGSCDREVCSSCSSTTRGTRWRSGRSSCPFDENAHLIRGSTMERRLRAAGFADCTIRYRIFFPHALRFLRPLEAAMTWLPLGGQYCALARRSPGSVR